MIEQQNSGNTAPKTKYVRASLQIILAVTKSGTGTWGLGRGTRVWDVGRVGWDVGTWGRGDAGTRGRGDVGTWGRGDVGTWGRGDVGTWGRGDVGRGTWGRGVRKRRLPK